MACVVFDLLLGSDYSSLGRLVFTFCEAQGVTTAWANFRKSEVFPLPLPRPEEVREMRTKSDCRRLWMFLLVSGLNYLNGGKHAEMRNFEPSCVQKSILDYLQDCVTGFLEHPFCVELFDWLSFLQTRSLSYTGEEVKAANRTSWANVSPALPYGSIGSISALELADEGLRSYIENPSKFLRPDWDQRSIPPSLVMVSHEDWAPLARGLVQYNLCCILPQSAIIQAGGTYVLNGLFGVEKGESHQGVPIHRLTMNLIPTNTLFLPVKGDVDTLPLLPQDDCPGTPTLRGTAGFVRRYSSHVLHLLPSSGLVSIFGIQSSCSG